MNTTKSVAELETELDGLVDMRGRSVGIDLKRTNYRIAQLSNKIDNIKAKGVI